ncbi:hypothetical protein JMG10_11335 [Nostoc ellipsosporum NOK]|nr:hypothetical protein [Nostoc ellipsosporum NOK]
MKKSPSFKPIFILCFLLLTVIAACSDSKTKPAEPERPAAVADNSGDSVVSYDIEGLSSEGGEATARYAKGQLRQCVLLLAGETGQRRLIYTFSGDSVKVEEEHYSFEEGVLMSDNDNKLQLDTTLHYTLDTTGKVLGAAPAGYTDVFASMKKIVRFKL